MLYSELSEGIEIVDENGKVLGKSKKAAKIAISQVVMSRIGMCVPGMSTYMYILCAVYLYFIPLECPLSIILLSLFSVLPPIIMNRLEKKGVLARYPWISLPLQVTVCGLL